MEQLTEEQKKAVSHEDGPACVIAGAGTGKTKALSERIFNLIEERHLDPNRILVTTFTRKATAELYDRTYQHLGEIAWQLKISTIDALILDLAQEAANRKLMPSARLIGESEQRVLLLYCAWETFGQADAYSRNSWTENADKAALVGVLETCIRMEMAEARERRTIKKSIRSRLKEMQNRFYLDFNFKIPTFQELNRTVKKYFEKLKELGATDYDLLSRDFLRCLRQHKKLTKEFASGFDAIMVDEFQDTSRVQAEILLLLSGKQRNIWVVGDPCQQIYEWRGAGPENLLWFVKKTGAKKYYLTDNWRSTQIILDCAYNFLGSRLSNLKRHGMLKPLKSKRINENNQDDALPVFTGTLDRVFFFVKQLLNSSHNLNPSDIVILSRKLDKKTAKEIEDKAQINGLKMQFHSSRADRAIEQTIGNPPNWKPGTALKNLYRHPKIQKLILHSLRKRDFSNLRTIRPIATSAEALDSTLPSQAFTFKEAWPALQKTQDREVSVTPSIVNRPDAIQVMTIHAAKGLEFPVVLLLKLGKGGPRSFPNPKNPEDSRLVYVGATRARDCLILVHTAIKPNNTLSAFGSNLVPIRRDRKELSNTKIGSPTVLRTPPIIAATHLDLYEQCPLKFAAYHEGRFLPKWSIPQSIGSRMHKALESYIRAGLPNDSQTIGQCLEKGIKEGDSPLRKLPRNRLIDIKSKYHKIFGNIIPKKAKVLAIEQRYRYLQKDAGHVEGVIDALIEAQDGAVILKEWKASSELKPDRRQQYELQARVGALAIGRQNSHELHRVEIVPLFYPDATIVLKYNEAFVHETQQMLERVFKDLRDRNYEPKRGKHCKLCQLKYWCPAW